MHHVKVMAVVWLNAKFHPMLNILPIFWRSDQYSEYPQLQAHKIAINNQS